MVFFIRSAIEGLIVQLTIVFPGDGCVFTLKSLLLP